MESYQVEQNEHDLWAKGTGQQADSHDHQELQVRCLQQIEEKWL